MAPPPLTVTLLSAIVALTVVSVPELKIADPLARRIARERAVGDRRHARLARLPRIIDAAAHRRRVVREGRVEDTRVPPASLSIAPPLVA